LAGDGGAKEEQDIQPMIKNKTKVLFLQATKSRCQKKKH